MADTNEVRLSQELISQLEQRADSTNFDEVNGYIEFILKEVLHHLDDPEAVADEETIKNRLESLGYVE